MDNVLVVRTYTYLRKDEREKLRANLQEQFLTGNVVILPPYTEAMIVPKDVEIEVQNLEGGDNHFIEGEYYRGKASKRYFKNKNTNS